MIDAGRLAELRDACKRARRQYNSAVKARDVQETVHKAVASTCEAVSAALVASTNGDPMSFWGAMDVIANEFGASTKALALAEEAVGMALREEGEAIAAVTQFISKSRDEAIANYRARYEARNGATPQNAPSAMTL